MSPMFPTDFNRYHEPFLGGGAVYLHLRPYSAHLADVNHRLIECYRAIRDEVDDVIARLRRLKNRHSKAHYYQSRERVNNSTHLPKAERAALQVYLNKTCYNGLYRENRRGHFNVPVGRYNNPSIFSEPNLHAVSERLKSAQLHCASFEGVLQRACKGDFVYFDPPYEPISKTSNFTSYTRFGFTSFDQARLFEVCRDLDARGVKFMLSNSSARLIRDLYAGFVITPIQARRQINSKASRRGPVTELVIRNYRS